MQEPGSVRGYQCGPQRDRPTKPIPQGKSLLGSPDPSWHPLPLRSPFNCLRPPFHTQENQILPWASYEFQARRETGSWSCFSCKSHFQVSFPETWPPGWDAQPLHAFLQSTIIWRHFMFHCGLSCFLHNFGWHIILIPDNSPRKVPSSIQKPIQPSPQLISEYFPSPCQASVCSPVLSRHNRDLEWRTLKPPRHVTALRSRKDHVIALRQISVIALFYLEESRKIHLQGMRAHWSKDTKRRAPQCAGERERASFGSSFYMFLSPWACPM